MQRLRLVACRRNSKGGLAIGLALIMLLFLIGGLCVEGVLIYSAANRSRAAARLAALAAVSGYYSYKIIDRSITSEDLHKNRLELAKTAFEGVIAESRLITLSGGDPEVIVIPEELPKKPLPGQAYLIPGSYAYVPTNASEEERLAACPPHDWLPPCFKFINTEMVKTNPDTVVNGFLVAGYINRGFTSLFGQLVAPIMNINVQSVATIRPRLFSFLIDRSWSTIANTHSNWDGPPEPAPLGTGWSDLLSWWESYFAISPEIYAISRKSSTRNDDLRSTNLGDPNYSKRHYLPNDLTKGGSDYSVISVRDDSTYGTLESNLHPDPFDKNISYPLNADKTNIYRDGLTITREGVSGNWIVDTYRDAAYRGPEPFSSILAASSATIKKIKQSAKLGDSSSMIAFSDNLYWPSVILPTNNFNYIDSFFNLNPNSKGFESGIFPTKKSNLEFTNIELALREFSRHLDLIRKVSPTVEGVPILITDGIHNCVPCNLAGSGTTDCDANGYSCKNDNYGDHAKAMQSLNLYLSDSDFLSQNHLHIILFGAGAHLRDKLGNGADGCMHFAEMVEKGFATAVPEESFDLRSEGFRRYHLGTGDFYYPSAAWANIAASSGGELIPIRKQTPGCGCTGSGDRITCSSLTMQQQIERGLERILSKSSFQIAYSL